MRCTDQSGTVSKVVDIFDGSSGLWRTAALSEARSNFAATSLPNQGLAIFAGGEGLLFYSMVDTAAWNECDEGGRGGGCVALIEARFEQLLLIADALHRSERCR